MAKTLYLKYALTEYYLKRLNEKFDLQVTDSCLPGLQMRYSAITKNIVFYLCYQIKGTRIKRSLKIGRYGDFTLNEIRAKAVKHRQEIQEGYDPALLIKKRTKALIQTEAKRKLIKELYPIYIEKYSKFNSVSSYRADELNGRLYIMPNFGNTPIDEINIASLQDWYNNLREVKTTSIANHAHSSFSGFLTWCERYEYRQPNSNPCRLVKREKAKVVKKYHIFNQDEYTRLFKAIDKGLLIQPYTPFAFLAIAALALTGCRREEILELQKDECAFDENKLYKKKSKNKSKAVFIADTAVAVIKKAYEMSESDLWVFPSPLNNSKPIVEIRRAWGWILEEAKLDKATFHDLRHSFATRGIKMGENILNMKELLTHSKITTTQIYLHATSKESINSANNIWQGIATSLDGNLNLESKNNAA